MGAWFLYMRVIASSTQYSAALAENMPRLAPVFLVTWLALLCAYAVPVEGTYGLDISSYLSINDFGCLKNNSYQFAIIRAYQSIGETIVIYSTNTHTDYGGGNAYLYLCMSCCIGRAVWGASLGWTI